MADALPAEQIVGISDSFYLYVTDSYNSMKASTPIVSKSAAVVLTGN